MPLNDIRQLIDALTDLDAVRRQARRQAALQQAFVDNTPGDLAHLTQASRVGYIKSGTLYLLADHAAVAAKLRQLLPRLLPVFQKLEAEITGIRVQVQVSTTRGNADSVPSKKSLPIDSIQYFEKLAGTVRDQRLKAALTNLVGKRSRSKR